MKLIMQIHAAAKEIKTTFAPSRIIWLPPRSSIPWQKLKIRKHPYGYRCTLDSLITFLIQFDGDPHVTALKWKSSVLKSYKNFTVTDKRSQIFMGGVKQLFDFIIFTQISGKSFLYAHTQQIYHANPAFHSVMGGILKCNELDLKWNVIFEM